MKKSLKLTVGMAICIGAFSLSGYVWGQVSMQAGYFNTRIDYATMDLDEQIHDAKKVEEQRRKNKELVDAGLVSALDLRAPNHAIEEFNSGVALLKEQKSIDAIKHLQKAVGFYPNFVSAHIDLGLAYLDQNDSARAQDEFEAAAKLDDKFPRPLLQLSQMALSRKDFPSAESALEKAATLTTADPKILSALAFAQNANHHYRQAVETAEKVHALQHKDQAEVHYVAATAAQTLSDFGTMEQQLNFYVTEDPTGPFAPVARKNLDILARNKKVARQAATAPNSPELSTLAASQPVQTFPDTDRLKAELGALSDQSEACERCESTTETSANAADGGNGATSSPSGISNGSDGQFTIRKVVDEVAQFFAVSSHGHMVSDLELSDIHLRDDNKPPAKVMLFAPQSKLPLLLGLLVDTSGSVQERFSFEKLSAKKFVNKVLSNPSDLAFITGFATDITVTQDFTANQEYLDKGIEQLTNGGGTKIFDAVSYACWKLAAYPERERVAKVLVILSDGEDNSSHRSLKQTIQDAETTGVTIYTVSTSENNDGRKTAADKVLQALAERSGGEAMFPGDVSSLGKYLDELRDLISSRYLIAYRPADFVPDGKYRTIQITAEKNGKRFQLHGRKGYYARLEETQK